MRIYAIQDRNTGLFVQTDYSLDMLGSTTLFFKNKETANRKLFRVLDNTLEYSPILEGLTWNKLESIHNKRREFIDVSYREYHDVRDSFNLEVVGVNVSKSKAKAN